ncbi:asparagine synthase (glutamine-hydrolyzing) [Altericista sp. CCNU0014]|uniref:asparagine synthase (glutamine-hydrolyzing) n=1 Tax=Altericista sp. CCNU0014 TaxID=3082949 RepID=UPI00384F36DE
MCAITGIAALNGSPPPTVERLKRMCDVLYHRGPDCEGMAVTDGVALGMRRLAIIDLAGGQQPMFNEDRTISTVFNGEIYNFQALRRDLQAAGHTFATLADTEVIVHGYEEYGLAFPTRLNGMFAIALHDTVRQRLLLARDHLGVKPLYYALTPHYLVWGSEIKAILASGLVERHLDLNALGEFMAWEYVPGAATLLKEIRKLEPGMLLELDLQTSQSLLKPFWDIPQTPENHTLTPQEWSEKIEFQLKKSVRQQLASDVPLGAFLSGGVDSSLIAASMGQTKTFSVGFEDPSYNELHWAKKVARHLNLDHLDTLLQPDVAALFDRLMQFMDDPIGDFSIFPTYSISQLARQHVKVVLSGDGGDELFGGYETYVADAKARQYSKPIAALRHPRIIERIKALKPQPQKKGWVNKIKRFAEGLEHPAELSHARWRMFAGEILRRELFTADALQSMDAPAAAHILELFDRAGDRQPLNKSLYVDVKSYLSDNILVKVDRMSMAVSLEARVPFLDPDLVTLAFEMPEALKVNRGKTKVLLKSIAARHIPRDCAYRPKEGFSIPIKHWLNAQFKPILEDYLDPSVLRQQGIFQVETVEALKREHFAGTANHSHLLWSLIVFQHWHRTWLSG